MAEKARGRIKPGRAKEAITARYTAFIDAYLGNGLNATQAAISAGYSARTAGQAGTYLLKHPQVKSILDARLAASKAIKGLDVQRTLREIARVAYADIRNLYDARGELKPMKDWDEDSAAAVNSIETRHEANGDVPVRIDKIRMADKMGALKLAAQIHHLAEAPPEKIIEKPDDLDVARRLLFLLDRPLRLPVTVEGE